MKTTAEQNLEIKKLKIAGNGVFAKKEIEKDKTIYFLESELAPWTRQYGG